MFGDRSFVSAAPTLRHSLPVSIRQAPTVDRRKAYHRSKTLTKNVKFHVYCEGIE